VVFLDAGEIVADLPTADVCSRRTPRRAYVEALTGARSQLSVVSCQLNLDGNVRSVNKQPATDNFLFPGIATSSFAVVTACPTWRWV